MTSIHQHRHTRCYGSPRMTRQLQALCLPCLENRVAKLMRQAGLRARPRRPYGPKTTRPDHASHPSPNRLAKAPVAKSPGTHLVSDITYIPTKEGWLYLAVVMDFLSRRILGWKLADTLHTPLVTSALRKAMDSGLVQHNALFHSDRGCQYSASSCREFLSHHRLVQSMSAAGYCYDNASMESFWSTLKTECFHAGPPPTRAQADRMIFDYIETFYNTRHLHSSLGYQSPADYERSLFTKTTTIN